MSTALAKHQQTTMAVGAILGRQKKTLEDIVPKHMMAERMVRIALAAINRPGPGKYTLADCTPESLAEGIITAVGLGLDLNDGTGRAWLIPRWDKHANAVLATFQIGYPGLEELAYRSGMVQTIYTFAVFEGDDFEVSYGLNPDIKHYPRGETRADMMTHVYSVVRLSGGGFLFEVMTKEQIDNIRNRSQARSGPWQTDYVEMARKTVLRRICKHVPKSTALQRAVRHDIEQELGPIRVADSTAEPAPDKVAGLKTQLRAKAEQEALPPAVEPAYDPETGEVHAERQPGADEGEDDFLGEQ